ncbi:MAG: CHAT domain-containing protein, partial [Bacteroidetes bacterium]
CAQLQIFCTFHGKMRTPLFFFFLSFSSLLIAQNETDPETLYFELMDQATEFVLAGSHDSALQKTIEAAAIWEDSDPFFGFLEAFEGTADIYTSNEFQSVFGKKDYKTAGKYYNSALEKFPGPFRNYAPEEVEYLADINAMLGNTHKRTSRILEAKIAYETALSGYRLLDTLTYEYDRRWMSLYIYKPLANIYTRLENYENAAALLRLSQSVLEENGKEGEAAQASIDLGILYATTGRHEEAIGLFSAHEDNALLSGYIKSILLLNKARSQMAISQNQAALLDIQKVIELSRSNNSSRSVLMDAYHILGQLQVQNRQFEQAKEALNNALELEKKISSTKSRKRAKIYVSLGNLYYEKKETQTAINFYQKSLNAVLDNIDTTNSATLPNIEDLYAENSILTALEGKASAYERLFNEMGNLQNLHLALDNLKLGFEVERLLSNTQQHSTSKIQFQKQNQSRREKAIGLCALIYKKTKDEIYIAEAFGIAEAGKAAVLRESIRENLALQQLNGSSELQKTIHETEKALAAIESDLLNTNPQHTTFDELNEQKVFLSQQLLTLKQELAKRHPEYAQLDEQPGSVISVSDVQEFLLSTTEEVFIEFYWGKTVLYAFKIDKAKGIELFEFPMFNGIDVRVNNYLDLFSAQNRWNMSAEKYQLAAIDVYQVIYKQLKVDDYAKVIIIPDGLLAFVPFEALVSNVKPNPFFKSLDYLIKSQNISYAYSGSVLKAQKESIAKGKSFLFVAPGFANNEMGLPALSDADLNIGKQRNLIKLSGESGTRNAFEKEAPASNIIHLFTHAEANPDGQQPRVFFYDQELPLSEIYALDLSAQMVVLSACETNLGKLEEGEGVMSLARGFAYAGATSLVASLWKVKNQQTAQIFTDFYGNLKNSNSKSEALRKAKTDFLDKTDDIHASPAYWTGFVFIGNDAVSSSGGGFGRMFIYFGLALMVAGLVIFMRGRK